MTTTQLYGFGAAIDVPSISASCGTARVRLYDAPMVVRACLPPQRLITYQNRPITIGNRPMVTREAP